MGGGATRDYFAMLSENELVLRAHQSRSKEDPAQASAEAKTPTWPDESGTSSDLRAGDSNLIVTKKDRPEEEVLDQSPDEKGRSSPILSYRVANFPLACQYGFVSLLMLLAAAGFLVGGLMYN